MRIIDAFLIADELAMAEFRFRYLDPYVDAFYVVEAGHTYSGEEKPLYFTEAYNQGRFAPFAHKIHIGYPDTGVLEEDHGVWTREFKQRNHFTQQGWFEDTDLLLMSDVDEIPDGPLIQSNKEYLASIVPFCFRSLFHYYSVQWLKQQTWPGIIGATIQYLKTESPQSLRDRRWNLPSVDSGWHFSYFGGVSAIQRKLRWFSHHEWNREPYNTVSHIQACIQSGEDLFNRHGEACFPNMFQDYLPEELLKNKDMYAWMFNGEEAV